MRLIRKLIKVLQDQRGVTLIELLAVIVILGIIAAIGIPALMDSREQAQKETYRTNATIMTEAAKRKMLMGETYGGESDGDKTFNLRELLDEANIAGFGVTEGSAPDGESGDASNAVAYVDENDEAKGVYELDVAKGLVTYNESSEEAAESEIEDESVEEDDTFDSDTTPVEEPADPTDSPEERPGPSDSQTFYIERDTPQLRQ